MKIVEGPMLFEITGLLSEQDVQAVFEGLVNQFKGRRLTPALQSYIFDELVHEVVNKIEITSTRLGS